MGDARWNHNIHYHPLLVEAAGAGGRVLDVGCGEGMLTRELARRAARVTGVDVDAASIELALATTAETNVDYVCADVFAEPFQPASFDAVVSVATLHHLGTEPGLRRLAELVRPGGTLAVIGLAASELPRPAEAAPRQPVGAGLTSALISRVLDFDERDDLHTEDPPMTTAIRCRGLA